MARKRKAIPSLFIHLTKKLINNKLDQHFSSLLLALQEDEDDERILIIRKIN